MEHSSTKSRKSFRPYLSFEYNIKSSEYKISVRTREGHFIYDISDTIRQILEVEKEVTSINTNDAPNAERRDYENREIKISKS